MRKLLVPVVTGALPAGCGTAAPPEKSVADVAKTVGEYLASHKNVSRTFRSQDQTVTLLTDGTEEDLTAALGDEFSGRVIKTKKATYFQVPLGKEVAPGKLFDQVTDYHEPSHLFGTGALRITSGKLLDEYRVYELFAKLGTSPVRTVEGGLVHYYTVTIDMTRAVERMDLAVYLRTRDPMPFPVADEKEYENVRAGDGKARDRVRAGILAEFGPSAAYDVWVDGTGRPVRVTLTARRSAEITLSGWGPAASRPRRPPVRGIGSLSIPAASDICIDIVGDSGFDCENGMTPCVLRVPLG